MSEELWYFNGVDGTTGEYLLPPMSPAEVSAAARGETFDEAQIGELKWRRQQAEEAHLGVIEGVDPTKLDEAGWGVIFAYGADPAVRDALDELLALRREQAGDRYREYVGEHAYRPGESKNAFLARHGTGPGPVDPERVPYYLLLVGDPEAIPYEFQYQLDVAYAVGRIYFDTVQEYAQYARSVVTAERGQVTLPRQATLFGVQNPEDKATRLSAEQLVTPLAAKLAQAKPDWQVQTLVGEATHKAALSDLVNGAAVPTLLFTASHGMAFPNGDARQLPHQGALLCQDWPGPDAWGQKPIPQDHYFAADDVTDDAHLLGLIAFHFACYGAGTPQLDQFAAKKLRKERAEIAPHAFVAALPRRLLGHAKGGALAIVGHVERAWGCSFLWDRAGRQTQVFESALQHLMSGKPIGSAIEYFNERHSDLAVELRDQLEEIKYGRIADDFALAGMWTANNDARCYVVLGDPAVRLCVGASAMTETSRRTITAVGTSELAATAPNAQSAPSSFGAAPATTVVEFGLLDGNGLKDVQASLAQGLQQLASRLGDVLTRAVDNASSLTVSTYATDDMSGVTYDAATRTFSGTAKLRALTRMSFDGDTLVCVPESSGQIDQPLWAIHLDMVQRAQASRTELVKAAASAATGLLGAMKGL